MDVKSSKEIIPRIVKMLEDIEEILRNIFESMRLDKLSFIEQAEHLLQQVNSDIDAIVNQLSQIEFNHERLTVQLRVVSQLKQIIDHLHYLVRIARQKNEQSIVFSEKALREVEYLIGTLKYLIHCLAEMVSTSRPTFWRYLTATAISLEDTISRFATEHEERLISGLCLPRAAPIYLNLLEACKEIVWLVRVITREIAST